MKQNTQPINLIPTVPLQSRVKLYASQVCSSDGDIEKMLDVPIQYHATREARDAFVDAYNGTIGDHPSFAESAPADTVNFWITDLIQLLQFHPEMGGLPAHYTMR